MIRPSRVFTVVPTIPPALATLEDLAYNLRWTWDHQTAGLFRRLDPARWEATNHNPVLLLRSTDQVRLNEAARDPGYRRELAGAAAELTAYLDADGTDAATKPRVAYFSAEFGLAECLPIYSGGLGVLSGDHLKSASDLNLSLTGVSLFYKHGYFLQRLRPDGWQEEQYPENDPTNLPIRPALGADCKQVILTLRFPGRDLLVQVWHVAVGRITLFLLDTDLEGNQPADRAITSRLYGGDRDMRIRQELLLGIGGVRALDVLGRRPEVCHMNEGHSSFLALERIRQLMGEGDLTFEEARAIASAGMVFTTHTPVAAGHDAFDPGTIDYYLGDYYRELGLSRSEFMALGRLNPSDEGEPFSMTILALRLAGRSNGVSILHGGLSRRLWGGVWPGLSEEEVPTGSVTNGVHLRTWLAPELADLYEGLKSPDEWSGSLESTERLRAIDEAPARELWDRHERLRAELVHWVRARLASQLARQNAGPSEVSRAVEALDPKALTIGFARRFAEYKRATLLLRDADRLIRLVNDSQRPVQFIFAGKAHPSDNGGKELLRYLVELSKRDEVRGRIVVLEDYDIGVARRMVQGVDVWLNTPRRPMEASGTSGMKAVANGALHVGTLDGWWDEAYRSGIGWAIGDRRSYDDPDFQDQLESISLYDVLEREIVPLYYERDAAGLPQGWIARMRASMGGLPTVFNTDRMVHEYLKQYYEPAARDVRRLSEENLSPTREAAAWIARVYQEWPRVQVVRVQGLADTVAAGTELNVEAEIALGGLRQDEVEVHLASGLLDGDGILHAPTLTLLEPDGPSTDGAHRFGVRGVRTERSGRHGYAVRVTPRHPSLPTPFPLGLVRWSD
ncbi:MAG TPA: alpha-glucan family phosphorylase [Chloroflexota bacterium]|nr:alpha-glucan family phosphorylase [Chloroflexota bacterium]